MDKRTYSYRAQIEKKDEFGDTILNEFGQRTYESVNKTVNFKGNFISGASIEIDNEEIVLSKKAQWFELVLMWLPFIFVLIWVFNSYQKSIQKYIKLYKSIHYF